MPTTKRLRRHARTSSTIRPGSTRWQLLKWDDTLLPDDGPGFESAAEARAAWREVRGDLMRDAQPGTRPAGYYRFDLGVNPPSWHWYEQLAALLDRDLVDARETVEVEALHMILRGNPDFCSGFDNEDAIGAMRLGDVLKQKAVEFDLAARWHAWRGRPELAARYERRAANVRGVLELEKITWTNKTNTTIRIPTK